MKHVGSNTAAVTCPECGHHTATWEGIFENGILVADAFVCDKCKLLWMEKK